MSRPRIYFVREKHEKHEKWKESWRADDCVAELSGKLGDTVAGFHNGLFFRYISFPSFSWFSWTKITFKETFPCEFPTVADVLRWVLT